MLDILINAYQNNEIDDEGIREEVDTFVFEVSIKRTIFDSKSSFSDEVNLNFNVRVMTQLHQRCVSRSCV